MTPPDTTEQTPERRGFSSRWILDGDRRAAARAAADDAASAAIEPAGVSHVETTKGANHRTEVVTDGGGRSTLRAFGRWLGRSIVSIVVVASLVAAAVATTELLHARDDRDAAQAALADVERDRDAARAEVTALQESLQSARDDAATDERAVAAAEAERDGVELENRALRSMLLDAERSSAADAG